MHGRISDRTKSVRFKGCQLLSTLYSSAFSPSSGTTAMLQMRKPRHRVDRVPCPTSPLPRSLGRSELPLVAVKSGSSAGISTVPVPVPELCSESSHPMVLSGAEPCSLGYCFQSPCPCSTVSLQDTPISVITVLGIHLETGHLGHF